MTLFILKHKFPYAEVHRETLFPWKLHRALLELCAVFKEREFPKSLRDYKELDYMKLKAEATRFREVTGVSSLHEAKLAYRGMNDMERAFFPQVFEFMKILLACPVSSSTAERSFSRCDVLKLGWEIFSPRSV